MDPILVPPAKPVAITDGFIQKEPRTVVMQCHDRYFKSIDVVDQSGEPIFTVESDFIHEVKHSWNSPKNWFTFGGNVSWRRTVKDAATGSHLFDFRKVNRHWELHSPNGLEVCIMRRASFRDFFALDLTVKNELDKGNEEVIEVRAKDKSGLTVLVTIGQQTAATIHLAETNITTRFNEKDRTVWRAEVAEGVDLGLVRSLLHNYSRAV
jgi:hypothetical protein